MGILDTGTDIWEWLKTLLQGNAGMVNTTTGEVGQSRGILGNVGNLFREQNLPKLMAIAGYFQNAFPGRTQYKQSTIGNISKGLLGAMQGYTGMQGVQRKSQEEQIDLEKKRKLAEWEKAGGLGQYISPITERKYYEEGAGGPLYPSEGTDVETGNYNFDIKKALSGGIPSQYISALPEIKKLLGPEGVDYTLSPGGARFRGGKKIAELPGKKTRKFQMVGTDPNNPNNDLWATVEDGEEISERVSRSRSPERKVYHPYKIQKKVGGRVVTDTVFDEETKALRLKNGWTEGEMEKPEKPITEQGAMEVKKTKKDMIKEALNRRYAADTRFKDFGGDISKLPNTDDAKAYNDIFINALGYGKTMDSESAVDKALTDWHNRNKKERKSFKDKMGREMVQDPNSSTGWRYL